MSILDNLNFTNNSGKAKHTITDNLVSNKSSAPSQISDSPMGRDVDSIRHAVGDAAAHIKLDNIKTVPRTIFDATRNLVRGTRNLRGSFIETKGKIKALLKDPRAILGLSVYGLAAKSVPRRFVEYYPNRIGDENNISIDRALSSNPTNAKFRIRNPSGLDPTGYTEGVGVILSSEGNTNVDRSLQSGGVS